MRRLLPKSLQVGATTLSSRLLGHVGRAGGGRTTARRLSGAAIAMLFAVIVVTQVIIVFPSATTTIATSSVPMTNNDDETRQTTAAIDSEKMEKVVSGGGASTSNVVQCSLSRDAARAKVSERLAANCRFCLKRGSEPLPDFCAATTDHNNRDDALLATENIRYDFSMKPTTRGSFDPAGTELLTVVYSALGQRFHGPGGQSYVVEAIRQWRLFHGPDVSEVYLLLDDNMTKVPEIVASVALYEVTVVTRSEIMTPLWKKYEASFYVQGYMHPGGSRTTGHKQFNKLVSERFFALHGVMQLKKLTHVLHFENDNMVYHDMRPIVAAADRCGYGLASTFANRKHVIPGVLYIRDVQSIEALCSFLAAFLSCGEEYGRRFTPKRKDYANDMTYMMTFYQRYGSRALGALPAWEHAQGENCMAELLWQPKTTRITTADEGGIENRSTSSSTSLGILTPLMPSEQPQSQQKKLRGGGGGGGASTNIRGAIFDLGSFGQWYSFSVGTDKPPLHVQQGILGRYIDATPLPKMEWVLDEAGRKVPVWKGIRILSLHVHAKNLDKFRSLG